jgi:pyruvate carboxylase
VGPVSSSGQREVFFELNGETRAVSIDDKKASMLKYDFLQSANEAVEDVSRAKADPNNPGHVGAPMSGVVVEVRVKQGSSVKKGDPLAILSAMYVFSLCVQC